MSNEAFWHSTSCSQLLYSTQQYHYNKNKEYATKLYAIEKENKKLCIFLLFPESWNMSPNKHKSWYLMPRLNKQLWSGGGMSSIKLRDQVHEVFHTHPAQWILFSDADNPYKQN